jgi:hypothetical protein
MKKILSLIVVLFVFTAFIGCSEESLYESQEGNDVDNYSEFSSINESSRKMIYEVEISFDVDDLEDASVFLKSILNDDEWINKESISSRYQYMEVRVSSDRLDDFIDLLKDEYDVRTYSKDGTDISLEYQDMSNRILALEAQLTRLIELYEEASLSDMIMINEQISNIEVELQELNGQLNVYDSLIDYSVVRIYFYGDTIENETTFLARIGNAFTNGISGFVNVIEGIVIAIVTILPFVGTVGIVLFIVFKIKKSKGKTNQDLVDKANE